METLTFNSAGCPVPDFKESSQEEIEEYAWIMKIYEQKILPKQYSKIPHITAELGTSSMVLETSRRVESIGLHSPVSPSTEDRLGLGQRQGEGITLETSTESNTEEEINDRAF
jgi:hypothetical protein